MEAIQTANPPTFETVWAALQELAVSQKEAYQIINEVGIKQKENAEQLEKMREKQKEEWKKQDKEWEKQKETERVLKEESQRQKDDFNIRLGALTNLFGDMTEAMVAPKICEKFISIGLDFHRANQNVRFNDSVNHISFEVDILLENGDKAMLVEVKTKLTIERVNKNREKLEKMRKYADLRGDKRVFLGAVAGIAVTDEVREYALNQGFYFIEYSGENFYITPPNGKPKEF